MPENRRLRALAVGCTLVLLVATFSVDYTVRRGDTLRAIADEHDVSISDLVDANSLNNPNLIFPGQILVIPGAVEPDKIHVVVRGESLSRIAGAYGTSVSALVSHNSISNPNLIRIGQEILIPSGSSGSTTATPPSDNGQATTRNSSSRTGRHHVVRRGESVKQIASQYSGVSAADIVTTNGIINEVIYAGTRLFLDGPGHVAKGTAGELSYTVKKGDRLGDIAAKHGAPVNKIVEINNISNPNLIRSGQTLAIPSGTAWICPVDNASFFNDWGFPRGGGTRYHEGNDLFAAQGTPVKAPVSGTVEFVTGEIGGLQFRLYGDDGVKYIGSHMAEFGKDGKVRAGDVLGYVGTTGNAKGTPPHLHFGMYLGSTVINPYPTLISHGCR